MSDAIDYAAYAGPQRVFSGVQPTGMLTLGNYLGALKKFQVMQRDYDCLFCVVDMHAITVRQEPEALRAATRGVAAAFIAAGVDPETSIVFNQSAVAEHAELAWIFNCVARMGWLSRMTQFKDKAGKDKEAASTGLFVYPNLMAADILAYRATHVPVGEDQKQHLELARDIAIKFNTDYDRPGFFPTPEPLIQGPGARVMSLRDGTKKMSKSDPSDMSRILLTDDDDAIAQKIRKAKTDPEPLPESLDGLADRPEVRNLVGVMAALTDRTDAEVLDEWGGKEFRAFKPALADICVAALRPVREELARLTGEAGAIDAILKRGAERARDIAGPIVRETKETVGFLV